MELSTKQLAFCHQYLMDYNAPKAAVRVGYSPRSIRNASSELMRNPAIRAQIASLMEMRFAHHLVSTEYVIGNLVAIVNEAREQKPELRWNNKTQSYYPTGLYVSDGAIAIKGLVALGQMLGLFSDFASGSEGRKTRPNPRTKSRSKPKVKTPQKISETKHLTEFLSALNIQLPSFT